MGAKYHLRNQELRAITLDIGYTTTSISVVQIEATGEVNVEEYGISMKGGRDVDRAIADHCVAKFNEQHGTNFEKSTQDCKELYKALEAECERAKKQLQQSAEVTITRESFYDEKDLEVTLTQDQLKGLCEEFLSQLNEVTDRALDEAFFYLEDEKEFEVLLVGGSTRLLLVREWVKEKFNKAPDTSVPPEEVIA